MSQTYSQTLVELFACGASLNPEGIAVIYDNGKEKQNMTYTQLVNAVQNVCYPSRGLAFTVNKGNGCMHLPAQSTRTHLRLKGPTSTRLTNSPMCGVAPLAFQLAPRKLLQWLIAAYLVESLALIDSRQNLAGNTGYNLTPIFMWGQLVTGANWQWGKLTVNLCKVHACIYAKVHAPVYVESAYLQICVKQNVSL